MPTTPPSQSADVQANLAAAEASATLGVAQGEIAFTLTKQALQESEAIMVFPLLAVSAAAITEGVASYLAQQANWEIAEARVKALVSSMKP